MVRAVDQSSSRPALRRLRVLLIAPRHPNPPLRGDQRRVFNLARGLSNHCEVRVATFGDGLSIDGVEIDVSRATPMGRIRGNLRRPDPLIPLQVRMYIDSSMDRLVDDVIRSWRPDVIHVTLARMGPYARAGTGIHQHVDFVDSLARNMATRASSSAWWSRPLLRIEARAMRRYEAMLARGAASSSVVSAADAAEPGLESTRVVPNGVDFDDFPYSESGSRGPTLIFFGNLGYFHNIAPARFVATEVLPRIRVEVGDARLRLVGARPAPAVTALAGRPGVDVVGPVEYMVDHLHEASVAVLPMFSGSGIKNKVLEAMSAGTPVVSNRLGVEGVEGLVAGLHYLEAETADEVAAAVLTALRDPAALQRLAMAARSHVLERYGWEPRVRELLTLYGFADARASGDHAKGP